MMKQVYFLTLAVLTATVSFAQELSKADSLFADSVMNANYKPGDPGAVLLIAKNGNPVFRKAYGMSNLEFSVPNRPENIFRIGSMSKQFTAVCMLKLAQENKLKLEDDITKYLPAYNTHGRHITIENLLTHTSGIKEFGGNIGFVRRIGVEQSDEDLQNTFMKDSLDFEPGTDWSYSNSGYVLSRMIIEKVSGLPFKTYLQRNIFDPLNMSHSLVGSNDSIVPNYSSGYDPVGNGKFVRSRYFSWTWPNGAGGLLTNVDDLLKWDNALYTDKIVKQEWLEKAWKNYVLPNGQSINYGFGWGSTIYKGIQIIEHGGGIGGFLSDGLRVPSLHLYIALLSNSTIGYPTVLTAAIALHLLGLTLPQPASVYIDKNTLLNYSGVYSLHRPTEYQKYQYFTILNDTLFTQTQGYPKEPLLYISKDFFVTQYHNPYYLFHRNRKGDIISVEYYNLPLRDDGLSQLEFKTNLPLPTEKKAAIIGVDKLNLLKGKYDFGANIFIFITVEGNKIYMKQPGQDKEEIFAEDETLFFSKQTDSKIEFIKNKGLISGMVVINNQKYDGKKVE